MMMPFFERIVFLAVFDFWKFFDGSLFLSSAGAKVSYFIFPEKFVPYRGAPGKSPGGWGFFPPIFAEASLNKNPKPGFTFFFICNFKVKSLILHFGWIFLLG